jgi:TonB family protein
MNETGKMKRRMLARGAALALAAIGLPGHGQVPAQATRPMADFDTCDKPAWPRESLRFEQQGTVTLAFLIDARGGVSESKIVASSGFPLLDASARDGIGKCRFAPARKDGQAVTAWAQIQYVWTLTPPRPPGDLDKHYDAAGAAEQATVAAEAERGVPQALEVLTRAAVRGTPAAQLWMGVRYEEGKGVPRDYGAAAAWYRKVAAAGDRLGKERLAHLYDAGLGIPEDKAAAMALRKAAAAALPAP